MATKVTKRAKKTVRRIKLNVIKQNVGIDISKDDFKVCIYQLFEDQSQKIKSSRTFKNKLSGFTSFLEWLHQKMNKGIEKRATIEATGVYFMKSAGSNVK